MVTLSNVRGAEVGVADEAAVDNSGRNVCFLLNPLRTNYG